MSRYTALENLIQDPQGNVIATIHQPTTGAADALASLIADILNEQYGYE